MLSIKVTITGHAGMEKLMGCVRLSNSWIYFTYRNHFSPDYTFRGFDLIVRRLPAPQEPEENGTGEEGDHDEQHILSASHFYRLGPITTKYRMQKKTYTQGQFDHGEHSVTWAWNRHVIIPFICVNKNPFSLFIDTTSSQVHGLFIIFHYRCQTYLETKTGWLALFKSVDCRITNTSTLTCIDASLSTNCGLYFYRLQIRLHTGMLLFL